MLSARTAESSDRDPPDQAASTRQRVSSNPGAGPSDRDHLLDRLQHLRGILPVFAQELASARRQAASLRIENRRLAKEVRRLRQQRDRDKPRAEGG